jgi:hypothetical protein
MADGASDNKVQLGCGTLIIIAIIVALFSGGRGNRDLRRQLEEVNQKLDRLEQKLDDVSRRLAEQAPVEKPAAGR